MSKLSRLSWLERRNLNKVLKPVGHALSNPKTRQVAVVKSIRLLKEATQREMQEWVYWYTLGDFLLEAGFADEGLRVCSFCYHLRPEDPRSTYGLASAFRQLSDARLMGKPGIAEAIAKGKRAGQWVPNPEASKAALARLGLTVDESASAAIYFFMKTLGLEPVMHFAP
jgi:hypothetical protein